MSGIAVSSAMFLLKGIPEGFLIAWGMHSIMETKVQAKKYILLSLIYILVTYLIRFLPITLGINTVLSMFMMIISFQLLYNIELSKALREVIAAVIILVLTAASEIFNVLLLIVLYGRDKANVLVNSTDGMSQAVYTSPSTIFLGLFMVGVYFVMKAIQKRRRKQMEKLVRRLTAKIAESLGYDAEKEAVVAYGLLAIVQITVITLLALLLGFIVGAPVEAMIVCFSVSILRKYSGGAHAYDADFCTIVSIVYCTLAAAVSKWLVALWQPTVMLIIMVLCYGAAYLIIYRHAPVDSPNKPITSKSKIKRMRTGSFATVSIYLALQLFFYFFVSKIPAFRSYGISLLLGVAWQTLTLTPLGAILLNKLNDLPKYLRKEI